MTQQLEVPSVQLPAPAHEVTWTLPWVAVVVPLVLAGLGIAVLVSR